MIRPLPSHRALISGCSFTLALLAGCFLIATPALGHGNPHCHKQVGDKLVDWPKPEEEQVWPDSYEEQKKLYDQCIKSGGRWRAHTAHCHKEVNGRPKDISDAVDRFDCTAKGGQWDDYGHDLKK